MNSDSKIYDILFVELVPAYECYIPLAEKFKIPVIGTLSSRPWMHTSDVFGDLHPLSIPTLWSPLPKKMSFFQRLENIIQNAYASLLIKYIWEAPLSDFLDQYFPDFDLKRHRAISLIFTINHVSVLATPLIPKVVEVTGIHLPPVKPLPQMIEKFINESENGVILLSFGSIANSNVIDSRLRNIFRDTFSCIQQRVIWKFDKNIERISENVLVSDWIPQSDILAHKNVKLFITHTGIKGMYEAIDAGVPLVCIPLFWDQPSNAGLIEDIGAGIRLDLKTLTKEILLNAINNILFDERYSKKMQKLSSQFKDRPMSPQQSVIYWTEYVLRHNGTQHLQPTSVEIPWHQYLLLDVIFFISFVVFTFSSMLWLIFKLCSKIWKSIKN
ncbi:hypothetical protein V9T40_010932 [Parthenolecanium corni]|uniref:UDP-glucuronosyltransferase n=1 Tax=Parthenolecanium corni TaxID=536013 RepID=A0AAN9T633_9HEMI